MPASRHKTERPLGSTLAADAWRSCDADWERWISPCTILEQTKICNVRQRPVFIHTRPVLDERWAQNSSSFSCRCWQIDRRWCSAKATNSWGSWAFPRAQKGMLRSTGRCYLCTNWNQIGVVLWRDEIHPQKPVFLCPSSPQQSHPRKDTANGKTSFKGSVCRCFITGHTPRNTLYRHNAKWFLLRVFFGRSVDVNHVEFCRLNGPENRKRRKCRILSKLYCKAREQSWNVREKTSTKKICRKR